MKRTLPQTDPLSRQIMMSHGKFLEFLELLDLTARECGLRADIALFSQGAFGPGKLDTCPVATVRLAPDAAVQKDPLFVQILQRHTNRSRYDISRAVPSYAWMVMAAAATHPALQSTPVRVDFAGLEQVATALENHRRIASDAWRIELTVPRTIMESFDVLRVGQSEIAAHRDGLSVNAGRAYARVHAGAVGSHRPGPGHAAVVASLARVCGAAKALCRHPRTGWCDSAGRDGADVGTRGLCTPSRACTKAAITGLHPA